MRTIISILIVSFLFSSSTVMVNAYTSEETKTCTTIEPIVSDSASFSGYILYNELWGGTTFLINNTKKVVHTWKNLRLGMDAHLLENGILLRSCSKLNFNFINFIRRAAFTGGSGRVEKRDWNNSLLWEFEYSDSTHYLHHDIEPLPNGNILMIAYEKKTRREAIDAGRDPNLVYFGGIWPDHIIEVKPTLPSGGIIVWEWHAWDHLIQDFDPTKANYGVVADHPELIDINLHGPILDWMHINSVDYNEEFDQILLSPPNFNEIWVIDHNTTTAEAASHTGGRYGKGGDLLYRWGNPQNYRAGTEEDQQLFFQHDSRWIDPGCPGEGHILVFNSQRNPSSVDEIIPPVDSYGNYYLEPGKAYGPDEPIWSISSTCPYNFNSIAYSGTQRLPDGNTLISSTGDSSFFVVTPLKELIWKYTYAPLGIQETFKMEYYPLDYPGVQNLSLPT